MTTSDKMIDMQVRIGVLEKLVDRLGEACAKAEVASKTADKALQMSQEALGLYATLDRGQPQESDPWDVSQNNSEAVPKNNGAVGNDELGSIIS